ncbi:NAD(P)H-hydrate epimerase [Corynebacterium pelargi]|uniref:ADP-dependent (S)-NAD(P)H-hydrate dehydratase n=1 Tax=Corynebacterium pelargi TaxID=1471400 RepID=A0A410WBT5_9CORY|nr:NAD(P)H-hydrate epimerase [Corynebacterium pelargi]QAU53394.1 Bifunctional NAD(P)H-hydrate repair enzyme Nnr [Corynebacterium pelargi]GGG72798.1 bifunctional NAD(P)H-hydrate repair enzyme Nnr [Corynebacterium pelargi]
MSLPALPSAMIAAIEAPLIEAAAPDALMQEAAHHVALAARSMVASGRVVVLAGSGGNGGDGLYAGAELAMQGYQVQAILTGSRAHEPALQAFMQAGGEVIQEPGHADLLIDAMLGIGASGELRPNAAELVRHFAGTPTLSVDVPSGIHPDTGLPEGEVFVQADVCVTFGAPRMVHGLSHHCGQVWVAEVEPIGSALKQAARDDASCALWLLRAIERDRYQAPQGLRAIQADLAWPQWEPTPTEHKYSGVAGILAGSQEYPGAGVLAVAGAIHTTPSMKHVVAPDDLVKHLVLQRYPEMVCTQGIEASSKKVQAWLFGPGCTKREPLRTLLQRPEPLVLDASGLGMVIEDIAGLQQRQAPTILTPHAGEFATLAKACGVGTEPRLEHVQAMARKLECTVLLKGRFTLISDGTQAYSVDAGHGWLATPGSGDVLSGILVALVAKAVHTAHRVNYAQVAAQAAVLHARAGWLAARTPSGHSTMSALAIAEAVPEATAQTG